MTRLLADCGNSSIKLALAHAGGVWLQERLPPSPEACSAFLAPHREAIAELALLPGSSVHAAMLRDWWRAFGAGRRLREVGVELALPDLGQYAGCGADRVLAGLAACAQERRAVLVIDAGTATTFGAWRFDASAADPRAAVRFAGGLILPGARACAAGLAALAPALPRVEPLGADASAAQHDTAGAIAAAIGIGHPAMVGACLDRLRLETGIADLVVTGGNAGPLLGGVAPRGAYRPALVIEGIEMLCRLSDT